MVVVMVASTRATVGRVRVVRAVVRAIAASLAKVVEAAVVAGMVGEVRMVEAAVGTMAVAVAVAEVVVAGGMDIRARGRRHTAAGALGVARRRRSVAAALVAAGLMGAAAG